MQIMGDIGRWLGDPGALDDRALRHAWGAILDEAVDDFELGAVLATLASRGASEGELAALHAAAIARVAAWSPPLAAPAVLVPAYGALPGEAAWVAIAAALLPRFGIPVVVHGVLDSPSGISAARVLREMGVPPSASFGDAEAQLAAANVAFVPVALVSRAFARLIAMRTRLAMENVAHIIAPSLPVLRGAAMRLVLEAPGTASAGLRALDTLMDIPAITLAWPAHGCAWHVTSRPCITHLESGMRTVLFEADSVDARNSTLVLPPDAVAIAQFAARIAEGTLPVPVPALNLVAACLLAAGQAPDLPQAKAVAAIHAGRLAA